MELITSLHCQKTWDVQLPAYIYFLYLLSLFLKPCSYTWSISSIFYPCFEGITKSR